MTVLIAGVVLMMPLLVGAQTPPPAAATQNPSPMVEATRAHERLVQRDVGGAVRSFVGPAGKTVELWIPDQTRTRDTVDVVVHFHGAAWLPQQAVARLESPAVAAVVNLGAGSSGYHRAFTDPTAFDSLLSGVEREVSAANAKAARVRSVTLVAFSAGHGAVRAILRERRHFMNVDAVLLLDGMHTSYVPEGNVLEKGGALDTTNLMAFTEFARAAIRGEKRFLVTHSEIFPGTFASTTETADWLLRALGLRRTPVLSWGPRGMQQLSEVRTGGFEVLGFAGNSAPDHVDHLHAMPEFVAALYGNYRASGPPATVAKPLHHYVFFGQDREKIATASFLETKALEGAQVAYSWRQLEPKKDAYDLGMIREDLAFLTSKGKKLFIQLQDVTFSESRVNVPVYLLRDPIYNGGAARQYETKGDDDSQAVVAGWASRRWDPAVQERFHKLLVALGKEFDGRIEGINFAESSVGFGTSGRLFPKGFSFESYRDAIITNMKALKRAFPKSVAMQYGNFMPGEWRPTDDKGYLRAVYKAAAESNIAMGGPDLLPYRPGQLKSSYPLIREVAGVVPTGIAVQDGNLADINPVTGQRVQVSELVEFATEYLKVDYVFWGTEEPYYSQAVIPFLRRITIAERLGHPAGSKLLIIHADDLGTAHSVNAASFDALDKGDISSASVMVPTPWITEVAAYAKAHPNADLGLHLTITSEWETYRWGSVESADKVASLLDSAGTFPSEVRVVAVRAKPLEVERELRAQVERAIALGIRPTHLDSHMGALFSTPDLIATYVKVAREYRLPFLALRGNRRARPQPPLSENDVLLDTVIIAGPEVPRNQWNEFYLKAIADLKPGLTEMIVHLGRDDSELQAVTVDHEPYGSAWRQRDYDVVRSAEFKKALKDNHVIVVTWKDLQKLLPQPNLPASR